MGVIKYKLIYDGMNSEDQGIVIYGGTVDEIAERDVSTVEIPGRNGVLHLDNGRWSEREQKYLAYVPGKTYGQKLAHVRTVFGMHGKGYKRLEDSFNFEEFTLASFKCAVVPESMAFRTAGLVELTFNCRPERFLRTGEKVISGASLTMMNPTGMPARPLIRVYGTGAGTLVVGANIIYVDAISSYVDIDSDLCDCFKGSTNCNSDVRLTKFPVFEEGSTGISLTGSLTSVDVTPRWWRL